MKTVHEVARGVLRDTSGFPLSPTGPDLVALMERAIEADRAQLAEPARELRLMLTETDPGRGWAMPSADVTKVTETALALLDLIAEPREPE